MSDQSACQTRPRTTIMWLPWSLGGASPKIICQEKEISQRFSGKQQWPPWIARKATSLRIGLPRTWSVPRDLATMPVMETLGDLWLCWARTELTHRLESSAGAGSVATQAYQGSIPVSLLSYHGSRIQGHPLLLCLQLLLQTQIQVSAIQRSQRYQGFINFVNTFWNSITEESHDGDTWIHSMWAYLCSVFWNDSFLGICWQVSESSSSPCWQCLCPSQRMSLWIQTPDLVTWCSWNNSLCLCRHRNLGRDFDRNSHSCEDQEWRSQFALKSILFCFHKHIKPTKILIELSVWWSGHLLEYS